MQHIGQIKEALGISGILSTVYSWSSKLGFRSQRKSFTRTIHNCSAKLVRRYLYVGVSRATSHLAETMSSLEGNESIAKNFDMDSEGWS